MFRLHKEPTVPGVRRFVAVGMTCLATIALFWNPFRAQSDPSSEQEPSVAIQLVSKDSETRLVQHWGGVTRVPLHPKRICALRFEDELIALGVTPSAVSTDWQGRAKDYLRDRLKDVKPVPNIYDNSLPSFEAISEARPDLIIACLTNRHTYEQLSQIAPTVVLRDQGTFLGENGDLTLIKQRLRDLAIVIGREQKAEEAIAAFDAKVASARAMIAEETKGKTIAFFRTRGREWRLYGRHGMCGGEAIYDALGLQAPQMVTEKGTSLDPEKLVNFDADYLIIVSDGTLGADQTMTRLRNHPLWSRVAAVRTGHVLEITTYRHWVLSGLVGKARMIDEVVRCIRMGDVDENI